MAVDMLCHLPHRLRESPGNCWKNMFCSIRYAKELKPLFPLTEHPRVKLVAFLEQPVDVLFIEASGMADPSSMEHLLEQMDFLASKKGKTQRRYDYRGAICLIDAGRFLDFCDLFTPTQNQVMKSRLIYLLISMLFHMVLYHPFQTENNYNQYYINHSIPILSKVLSDYESALMLLSISCNSFCTLHLLSSLFIIYTLF